MGSVDVFRMRAWLRAPVLDKVREAYESFIGALSSWLGGSSSWVEVDGAWTGLMYELDGLMERLGLWLGVRHGVGYVATGSSGCLDGWRGRVVEAWGRVVEAHSRVVDVLRSVGPSASPEDIPKDVWLDADRAVESFLSKLAVFTSLVMLWSRIRRGECLKWWLERWGRVDEAWGWFLSERERISRLREAGEVTGEEYERLVAEAAGERNIRIFGVRDPYTRFQSTLLSNGSDLRGRTGRLTVRFGRYSDVRVYVEFDRGGAFESLRGVFSDVHFEMRSKEYLVQLRSGSFASVSGVLGELYYAVCPEYSEDPSNNDWSAVDICRWDHARMGPLQLLVSSEPPSDPAVIEADGVMSYGRSWVYISLERLINMFFKPVSLS